MKYNESFYRIYFQSLCFLFNCNCYNILYCSFFHRYKVVVVISIVQKLGQDVQIDFGKLWDIERDTYSTHVIETPEFAAMGLVVGAYYE